MRRRKGEVSLPSERGGTLQRCAGCRSSLSAGHNRKPSRRAPGSALVRTTVGAVPRSTGSIAGAPGVRQRTMRATCGMWSSDARFRYPFCAQCIGKVGPFGARIRSQHEASRGSERPRDRRGRHGAFGARVDGDRTTRVGRRRDEREPLDPLQFGSEGPGALDRRARDDRFHFRQAGQIPRPRRRRKHLDTAGPIAREDTRRRGLIRSPP